MQWVQLTTIGSFPENSIQLLTYKMILKSEWEPFLVPPYCQLSTLSKLTKSVLCFVNPIKFGSGSGTIGSGIIFSVVGGRFLASALVAL